MSTDAYQIFPASRWEVYDPDKDYGTYVSREGYIHTILIVQKIA